MGGKTLYSLPIEMTPPWWKSNLAYFLYFVSFLTLLVIIRKMILYRISLNNSIRMKELERQKNRRNPSGGEAPVFHQYTHEFPTL